MPGMTSFGGCGIYVFCGFSFAFLWYRFVIVLWSFVVRTSVSQSRLMDSVKNSAGKCLALTEQCLIWQ